MILIVFFLNDNNNDKVMIILDNEPGVGNRYTLVTVWCRYDRMGPNVAISFVHRDMMAR